MSTISTILRGLISAYCLGLEFTLWGLEAKHTRCVRLDEIKVCVFVAGLRFPGSGR